MSANPTSVGVGDASDNTLRIAQGYQAVTPATTAGLTVANVKATPGRVYGIHIQNPNASVIWIQFYNTAGTPVLGTSVAWSIPVAASATLNISPAAFALGAFTTGIGIGAATTATGNTAPGSAPNVTVFYQ